MSELLLSTNGLTKQYGHHKAVDKVNLHIKKGAIYGFIGRNGAGKTTCLKMISGLARPTAGEIEMFGCKGKELERIRSRVGCLIEAPGLYGNMNAYTNLKIKCELFHGAPGFGIYGMDIFVKTDDAENAVELIKEIRNQEKQ